MSNGGVALWGNGRFVFAQLSGSSGSGLLIDDETGKRVRVAAPLGCYPVSMGRSWLLFGCGHANPPQMKLYRVGMSGGWRDLTPSQQICSPPTAFSSCSPIAVGSAWVEYDQQNCQGGGLHCSDKDTFQNIASGSVESDPTSAGGRYITDLNSPNLAHPLCAPLRVPARWLPSDGDTPEPGTVTLYGRFAVTFGTNRTGDQTLAYLEKCGAHLHELIQTDGVTPPAGSDRAVAWSETQRELGIVNLSNLHRLTLGVPASIGTSRFLALGPRNLYMLGGAAGGVYTTSLSVLRKQ